MVSPRSLLVPVALLSLALLGCAPNGRDALLRSPTRDYRPPPPQTSDGRVVGVDNKPPEDHIDSGPTLDRLAPGWERDEQGHLRYSTRGAAIGPSGWEHDTRGRLRYNPQRRMDEALQGTGITPPVASAPR